MADRGRRIEGQIMFQWLKQHQPRVYEVAHYFRLVFAHIGMFSLFVVVLFMLGYCQEVPL